MNQDQVKDKLLTLDNNVIDFSVTFSGKTSKKVDGLYKPDTCEIIIHNKNFEDTNDNGILYTAIHEFAHHIHFTKSPKPVSIRAHTTDYWNILHKLLYLAEEKGIYVNPFNTDKDFITLTKKIKEEFLEQNGMMMKEFGEILLQAYSLCITKKVSFDDYMDRVLGLGRATAKTLMNINEMDINQKVGYENMKTLSRIKDEVIRESAENAFLSGHSPDMVKATYIAKDLPDDRLEYLMLERERLEKMVEKMIEKLGKLDEQINELKSEPPKKTTEES